MKPKRCFYRARFLKRPKSKRLADFLGEDPRFPFLGEGPDFVWRRSLS